ncbi:hypothetical protein DdX_19262 [Ditylenchus destructor]|uniref:Uncharacterized protein n=1 Tax=Ditylenchus destructor TaxID=166010 RepID=A0AAD4MKS0_9BILA|nr:hypothetical protein DdX_19262 [Ditylenchus destructor]
MFSNVFAIFLLKVIVFGFTEGSNWLSERLTGPEGQKYLAKVVAAGFLKPAKTLESIKIHHEGKELTFEVRSLETKQDVAALYKLHREVSAEEANDQDYRADKNFGFGAWLKVGNVSTMEAFLSISDIPPFEKSAWNDLLNKVEGMGNDSTDYATIPAFLSKEKYGSTELDERLFREVVQFYMDKHERKNGNKGKVGLIAPDMHYFTFYKSVGFKLLGQDPELEEDIVAVTFAHLKKIWKH